MLMKPDLRVLWPASTVAGPSTILSAWSLKTVSFGTMSAGAIGVAWWVGRGRRNCWVVGGFG